MLQEKGDSTDTASDIPPPRATNAVQFVSIDYAQLNARQKETYNFQKLSAVLADFGFVTMELNDDWQGADFIALHIDGKTILRIQLKGRVYFAEKYKERNLYIAFFQKPYWYLYPHDDVLALLPQKKPKMFETVSWKVHGGYSFGRLDPILFDVLKVYRIPRAVARSEEPIEESEEDAK